MQSQYCKEEIISAYNILEEAYSDGRKLLVAGNGGSASDSEHIVGELMKAMEKLMVVPFNFENEGAQVLYYAPAEYSPRKEVKLN